MLPPCHHFSFSNVLTLASAVTCLFLTLLSCSAMVVISWKCVANRHGAPTVLTMCSEMDHANPKPSNVDVPVYGEGRGGGRGGFVYRSTT